MERKKDKFYKYIKAFVIILYSVGLVLHLTDFLKEYLKYLTPIFLFTISIIVILEDSIEKKIIIWILVSYVFTQTMEIIGVKTGLIFGNYKYGENLGIKLFDVPIVIGLNWVTLILGSIGIISELKLKPILKAILVGLIMCTFDFVLEHMAPKLDFWFWQENIIPIKNYITWFLISIVFSYFFFMLDIKRKLVITRYNFILQFIFFMCLLILKSL